MRQGPVERGTLKDKLERAVFTMTGNPLGRVGVDIKHVLHQLRALAPKPLEDCTPDEARAQPGMTEALNALLNARGRDPGPDGSVATMDVGVLGAEGPLPARVYRPADMASSALPVILYFHGGGWVVADLDTYDATPRSMARRAQAVVISVHCRLAPEHKFPAAHEDALAAWRWTLANAARFGGDASRVAVMGEGSGANLALNITIAARDAGTRTPAHQVLVHPIVGVDIDTPSCQSNVSARPLNRATLQWYLRHLVRRDTDLIDPRLDVVGRASLQGLPDTTLVTAEIDPVRSDGEHLGARLRDSAVHVEDRHYRRATHEFFRLAAAVADASDAQAFVAERLSIAFGPARTH